MCGDVLGVVALEMETGEVMILQAKTTLLATGGAGRIFAASTNAFIHTGDGLGTSTDKEGLACIAGQTSPQSNFGEHHVPVEPSLLYAAPFGAMHSPRDQSATYILWPCAVPHGPYAKSTWMIPQRAKKRGVKCAEPM